ncbi:hypothetical protein Lser_V15G06095 [Lactuca serriola]
MDFSEISIMLRLKEAKQVVHKSVELCRISDLQFNSSNAGIVDLAAIGDRSSIGVLV